MTTQTPPENLAESQIAFDLLEELIEVTPRRRPRDTSAPRDTPSGDRVELALLQQLLETPPAAAIRQRPVALRSKTAQRRHALRGYRLRTWVDTALHQTERLLFVGAVLIFGYWFVDGPARDWLHYQQQSPVTAPAAAAALRPLAPISSDTPQRGNPRDARDSDGRRIVPLPYVTPDTAIASSSATRNSPPAEDFLAPRMRPLDAPVAAVPPQPTRLVVPGIGLDTPVKEVFIVDGAWEVAEYAAGYLHGTGLPGDGNTVLAGHAGLRGAVFRDIGALNPNDDVYLEAAGWTYHYRVRETKSVWPDQVDVLDPTGSSVLTMLTCTNWDTQRLVVVADLVDSKPSPGQ